MGKHRHQDPAYSDVHYVEQLIRADAINTMPEATLRAFADHGEVADALPVAGAASATLRQARDAGIDVAAVTSELEREGVRSFCDSYTSWSHASRPSSRGSRSRTTEAVRDSRSDGLSSASMGFAPASIEWGPGPPCLGIGPHGR